MWAGGGTVFGDSAPLFHAATLYSLVDKYLIFLRNHLPPSPELSLFHSKKGNKKFLWNIATHLPNYMVLHHRRPKPRYHCENMKYYRSCILFLTLLNLYKVSQEERAKLREGVPYVKLYRYNPKHLYPKLNGYGDNVKYQEI